MIHSISPTVKRLLRALVAVIGIFTTTGWKDISAVDRVRDTKIWAFAVRAPQTIQYGGQTVAANFVLGCVREMYDGRPLQLGAYIQFTQRVTFFAKGEFRFDEGEVHEFRSAGDDNTGYRISFSRHYEPAEFARLVSSSSRFRVQAELATGHSFFEFNLKKAGEVIAKLPCNPSH